MTRKFARSAESVDTRFYAPPLEALDHDEDKRKSRTQVEEHLHQ
jgi:hypothetical protein